MSIHTPLEIERLRRACYAGVAVHNLVPEVLQVGMTEYTLVRILTQLFEVEFGRQGYAYRPGAPGMFAIPADQATTIAITSS